MTVIAAEKIEFAYPGGKNVLHCVDFCVNAGEFIALLGANGCGKTTLFQHFNGLLKPNSGRITLDDKDMRTYKADEVFRRVGLVFQDPNDQLFAANVYEDVSYGPINLGLPKPVVAERVEWALEQVEMSEFMSSSLHKLSYGQKKRVAIAGVLALRPEVMILDEPTAGLDPRSATSLMRLLKSLQSTQGLTVILSTHEVDIVPVYCNRVYIMQDGKILREGTPEVVFSDPQLIRDAYLRLPRVAHLWEVLRAKEGMVSGKNPLTVREARKVFRTFMEENQ